MNQAILSQVLAGMVNGAFYALLCLGLAIIFGLLRLVNFAHGAFYALGAYCAWICLLQLEIPFLVSLVLTPLIIGALGVVIERLLVRHTYDLDHLYSLLVTYGIGLIIIGALQNTFGAIGQNYPMPEFLRGGLRFSGLYLPYSRMFVLALSLVVCTLIWLLIERTRMGMRLRAAVEDKTLVEVFGINVPLLMAGTFALSVGLASLAGVMAAPLYTVSPTMGNEILITAFAIVVIGGMGSIVGAVVVGFAIGVLEGLSKAFAPEFSSIVAFIIMVVILTFRPAGVFGRED